MAHKLRSDSARPRPHSYGQGRNKERMDRVCMRCGERKGGHYGRYGESFCDHPSIRDEEAGRIFVDSGILRDMRGEQYGFYEIPLNKISEPNVAFKMRKIKMEKRG